MKTINLSKQQIESARIANRPSLKLKIAYHTTKQGDYERARRLYESSDFSLFSDDQKLDYCKVLHEAQYSDRALGLLIQLEDELDDPFLYNLKANILRETGDHDEEALIAINEGLKRNPTSQREFYFYTRALIHMDLGYNEEAIQDYKETIRLESQESVCSTWYELAVHYSTLLRSEEALFAFHKAIEREEHVVPMYYYRLAMELREKGQYSDAVSYLKEASHLHQKLVVTEDFGRVEYFNRAQYSTAAFLNFHEQAEDRCSYLIDLAQIYLDLEQVDEALATYENAISLYPRSDIPFLERGLFYRGINKYEKAIDDFKKGLELDPTYPMYTYWLASSYLALEQYEKALSLYNIVIEEDPADGHILLERGLTLLGLKRYEEAEADYTSALLLDQENSEILWKRSDARMYLAKYEEALADLMKAQHHNPTLEQDPFFLLDVAMLLKSLDYYDEAAVELTKAIELDENHPLFYLKRAEIYTDVKRHAEALADCDRALVLGGNQSNIHWLRGLIYLNDDKPEEALLDAIEYQILNPADPASYYNLALVYAELADIENEVTNLETCLSIDPSYRAAYYQLAQLHDYWMNMDEALSHLLTWLELDKEWTYEEKMEFLEDSHFSTELLENVQIRLQLDHQKGFLA
ncbi:tetratricopeptide repeat protein [Bacillus suaedae]|uniref:Tetratricopeptide repeat protein n=1 Tax=Halalkalibacter suaedae TaxID=2822140 RepID=A0A941AQV9_9BACI|nr:tetratricopeptide repeat protein [Bacillus suaedae]